MDRRRHRQQAACIKCRAGRNACKRDSTSFCGMETDRQTASVVDRQDGRERDEETQRLQSMDTTNLLGMLVTLEVLLTFGTRAGSGPETRSRRQAQLHRLHQPEMAVRSAFPPLIQLLLVPPPHPPTISPWLPSTRPLSTTFLSPNLPHSCYRASSELTCAAVARTACGGNGYSKSWTATTPTSYASRLVYVLRAAFAPGALSRMSICTTPQKTLIPTTSTISLKPTAENRNF